MAQLDIAGVTAGELFGQRHGCVHILSSRYIKTLYPRAIALKLRALKDLEQVVVIPPSFKALSLQTAFEGLVFLE